MPDLPKWRFPLEYMNSSVGLPNPRSAVPRSKKCAPVRLHEYYAAQWARTRFPGDNSDKNVRWAVREWMVGKMG